MERLEKQINQLSIKYTLDTDKVYLKQFGQFFTLSPQILSKLLCGYVQSKNEIDILEPSAGTGTIILECIKHFKLFKLDAVEIDKNIYDKTVELFKNTINIQNPHFINNNFLKYNFGEKKYDLIIGNPPYFEITKESRSLITEDFNEILSGRINIYSLFIYKSIKLLKPNGQLIFIIPKTILSGKYFCKLRNFIHKHCNILDIVKFDNNKLFKKALQSVIILKLQLCPFNTSLVRQNYTLNINNELYFVKDSTQLHQNICSTSISKLNCTVKTGNIVWNQHKELLSDIKTESTLQLIMAVNIKNEKLVLIQNKNTDTVKVKLKKQFITRNDLNKHLVISGPYILINRIVGLDPPKLNIFFEKNNNDESKCFVENHVNFIKGNIDNLTTIYNSLKNPKTITFIKELIGNTQLSQYELENIIPIFN